jgi:excisionase family DNA binding protein
MSIVPGHLTTVEASVILQCDPATVCRYVRQNRLPHKRLGRNILIPEQAVETFEPPKAGNPNLQKHN